MFDYDGKTGNPYYNEVWNTLSTDIEPPKYGITSFYRQLILNEAYDLASGIYDGYVNASWKDPFMRIGMHPAEDTMCGSLEDRWMHLFTQYSIAELFGVSYSEFIQADVASCINMLKIAKNAAKIKSRALSESESLVAASAPQVNK